MWSNLFITMLRHATQFLHQHLSPWISLSWLRNIMQWENNFRYTNRNSLKNTRICWQERLMIQQHVFKFWEDAVWSLMSLGEDAAKQSRVSPNRAGSPMANYRECFGLSCSGWSSITGITRPWWRRSSTIFKHSVTCEKHLPAHATLCNWLLKEIRDIWKSSAEDVSIGKSSEVTWEIKVALWPSTHLVWMAHGKLVVVIGFMGVEIWPHFVDEDLNLQRKQHNTVDKCHLMMKASADESTNGTLKDTLQQLLIQLCTTGANLNILYSPSETAPDIISSSDEEAQLVSLNGVKVAHGMLACQVPIGKPVTCSVSANEGHGQGHTVTWHTDATNTHAMVGKGRHLSSLQILYQMSTEHGQNLPSHSHVELPQDHFI